MNLIADLVRDSRIAAGLAQVDLAEIAGTSQPAIARYEVGDELPTIPTLERILRACGRSLTVEATDGVSAPVSSVRGMIGPQATLLRKHRRVILDAASNNGLSNVRVFGSVATGRAGPDSDVDLLVDLDQDRTLLDLAAFRKTAQQILGVRVDAATPDMLKPRARATAIAEALQL